MDQRQLCCCREGCDSHTVSNARHSNTHSLTLRGRHNYRHTYTHSIHLTEPWQKPARAWRPRYLSLGCSRLSTEVHITCTVTHSAAPHTKTQIQNSQPPSNYPVLITTTNVLFSHLLLLCLASPQDANPMTTGSDLCGLMLSF